MTGQSNTIRGRAQGVRSLKLQTLHDIHVSLSNQNKTSDSNHSPSYNPLLILVNTHVKSTFILQSSNDEWVTGMKTAQHGGNGRRIQGHHRLYTGAAPVVPSSFSHLFAFITDDQQTK